VGILNFARSGYISTAFRAELNSQTTDNKLRLRREREREREREKEKKKESGDVVSDTIFWRGSKKHFRLQRFPGSARSSFS
jgi:hypothetical protein